MRTLSILCLYWCVTLVAINAQPRILAGEMPAVFDGVGVEERLGESVALSAPFVRHDGATVELRSYHDQGRPVVYIYAYHSCPMLCSIVLDEARKALAPLPYVPGEDYHIVVISFNPEEGPALSAEKRERFVSGWENESAADGIDFLTGDSTSIAMATGAVGFNYVWVEEQQEFAHPSVLIFAAPDGQITRYVQGLSFDSGTVEKAILEAGEGTVGDFLAQAIMYCFQYDPLANSYVLHAINLMKIGGGLTVLVIGFGLFVFWRRETQQQTQANLNPLA